MQVSLRNRIEKRYLSQVDLAPNHPRVRQYISDLAARGRYDFSPREVQSALGVSADAVKLALNRLAKQKLVASAVRGFWLIIPPEYRSLGCLPADQFIPALMAADVEARGSAAKYQIFRGNRGR